MTLRHTDDLCITPHESDRRALDGLYLCTGCKQRLERDLQQLPGQYAQLGQILGGQGSGASQRVSGSSERRLPIDPAVADHRHQIQHDLVWWAIYVADERGISRPTNSEPATTAAWLLRHVDWVAGNRGAAEEMPPVMGELAGRARGLLDPDRRLPTGERCRVVHEGERCSGVVQFRLGYEDAWTARCSVCGPQPTAPYMHEGLVGRWVTPERVVTYAQREHGVRIQPETVRQWASRGHIKAIVEGGAAWYELASVARYLTERPQRREAS